MDRLFILCWYFHWIVDRREKDSEQKGSACTMRGGPVLYFHFANRKAEARTAKDVNRCQLGYLGSRKTILALVAQSLHSLSFNVGQNFNLSLELEEDERTSPS